MGIAVLERFLRSQISHFPQHNISSGPTTDRQPQKGLLTQIPYKSAYRALN